jgi:hypothetical protein
MHMMTDEEAYALAARVAQLVIEMFCDEDVSFESVASELDAENIKGVAHRLRLLEAE